MEKIGVAIIGPGNIGTDLMIKILQTSDQLEVLAMVGIDENSEGLHRAQNLGIATTYKGIDGLRAMPEYQDISILFDATSAKAHIYNHEQCAGDEKQWVDLTPAAIGPYVIPVVNLDDNLEALNVNMVTCGGQATIPMVAAVSQVAKVHYAEIIASVASKSAGPGTRANIDEFTATTAEGIERVGGAARGKAIIILNPAEPPLIMRDTVYAFSDTADQGAIRESISAMTKSVQDYVPGYRLKQEVQFEDFSGNNKLHIPGSGEFEGLKTSIFLEVEGAAHYLPAYAGNLDIMTSAAMATGERLAALKYSSGEAA